MASTQVAVYYNEQEQEQDQVSLTSSSSDNDNDRSSCSSSPEPQSSDDEPQTVLLLDPSEHFRPEKPRDEFRNYEGDENDHIQQRVKRTYYLMHQNQTVDFVRSRYAKWKRFDHAKLTIMEALTELNAVLDESDPDNDLPNIVHAFQTAERIRKVFPDDDWLHLTGLIHDLGKVLALWGEEQWAVVGDTFVVGCQYGDSIVYRQESFEGNPDLHDPRYNTKYGIYEPNCGLDKVLCSWGHDEYMASVLENHPSCTLPKEAIKIIRFHSFYPWHTGGDYMHLCNDEDIKCIPLIKKFNQFDLYTKSDEVPDIDALMPYYQSLIDKYIPGKIRF